ncbi:MAG TPA: glycosyltransferase family 39 protein [Thermoanaerobaculia bacterium]
MQAVLASRATRVWLSVTAVAVVASAVHRWSFGAQSFFMDEIWVVEMVTAGRYAPGAVPQPPLYFFAAVLASRLCGLGELCLRLPALVASVLLTCVPFLAWRWSRTAIRPTTVAVWTILLGFSSPIAFYAARTKQYTTEALGSALLLASFLAVLAAPEEKRRWRWYFVLAAVLVPLLHSAALVIAGTGTALLLVAWRRDRRRAVRVLLAHAGLAVLFGVCYLAYMRPGPEATQTFGDLYDYFRANAEPVFFDGSFRFLVRRTAHWAGQMLNLTPGFVVVALAPTALWLLLRRNLTNVAIATACVLPPLLVLAISAAEIYPYGEVRLMIFAAPGLFLLIAVAVGQLTSGIDRRVTMPVAAVSAVLLVLFISRELRMRPYDATYMRAADIRTSYAVLRARHASGIPIVARKADAVTFRHYLPSKARDAVMIPNDAASFAFEPRVPEVWTFLRKSDVVRLRKLERCTAVERFVEREMVLTRLRCGRS